MTRVQLERLTRQLPGRVYLSRIVPSGEAEFLAASRASSHFQHPWMFPPTEPEGYAVYLARARQSNMEFFLVRAKEDSRLCGVVNVRNIVRGNYRSAFCGHYAFAGAEGRGLMRDGLAMVVWFGFGHLGLHRLALNIQPGNHRSIAVAKKIGCKKEGFSPKLIMVNGDWRDHERWAIRAETYPGLEKAMSLEPK